MEESATFRSPDGPLLGLFLLVLGGGTATLPLWATEADLLGTHARRGGIIKLIEVSIGWTSFCILAALFGLWLVATGAAALWKIVDSTPDVTALPDRLEFHPAVRSAATTYDDLKSWDVAIVSGHPVVTLRFHERYWSLKGMVPRRSVVLEGGRDGLEDLVNYLGRHPRAGAKFIG